MKTELAKKLRQGSTSFARACSNQTDNVPKKTDLQKGHKKFSRDLPVNNFNE